MTEMVDRWLEPLDGSACGEALDYDAGYLELMQAAAGKPETQFAPAQPPVWPEVRGQAEALLERTRDLRVALVWARSMLATDGLTSLGDGLRLVHGLLDRYWDEVHPAPDPDDGDLFARISALGTLADLGGMLGDLRQARLASDRRLGGMRVREVEIALERLAPRADEEVSTRHQIEGALGEVPEAAERIREACTQALSSLGALRRLMDDRFGGDRAPDVQPMKQMVDAVVSVLPPPPVAEEEPEGDAGAEEGASPDDADARPARRGAGGGVTSIQSRQDAVKAIHLICEYLERTEPTNPAQFLLRRAERLIGMNFLQLVRHFAPDAMNEVARAMGVDPESVPMDDMR